MLGSPSRLGSPPKGLSIDGTDPVGPTYLSGNIARLHLLDDGAKDNVVHRIPGHVSPVQQASARRKEEGGRTTWVQVKWEESLSNLDHKLACRQEQKPSRGY